MSEKRIDRRGIRILALIVCFAAAIALIPVIADGGSAFAASKPAKVKGLSVKAADDTSVTITWKKAKGAKGYQINRDGKAIKKTKARSFTDTGLSPNTSYKYKVRAYKTYKKTKYYNSKKGKWQAKKPAKKYWKKCPKGKYKGKKKVRVICYKYGKYSSVKTVQTSSEGQDTDGEGLIDSDEKLYGTSVTNPDTDGDTISDYAEVVLGMDPLSPDYYYDDTEDSDWDGLTDLQEAGEYKTDPYNEDTDSDRLNDYYEVIYYETSPTALDTDEDTLSDGFEVDNDLDPTNAKTDGVHFDGDVKLYQATGEDELSAAFTDEDETGRPSVKGNFKGELSRSIFISEAIDSTVGETRAIVGQAATVTNEGAYADDARLSFNIWGYSGDTRNLMIARIDDNGHYVPMASAISEEYDEISCPISEDGTYCVIDGAAYLAGLGIDVSDVTKGSGKAEGADKKGASAGNAGNNSQQSRKSEKAGRSEGIDEQQLKELNSLNTVFSAAAVSGQADIVFAVDTTGSMDDTIDNVVANIASFASTLADNYNVRVNFGLIDFKDLEEDGDDAVQVIKNGHSNWFSDSYEFSVRVNSLYADGGGDDPECAVDALETARRLDFRTSSSKFVILVTDASYKNYNRYGVASLEQEAELLARDGICTSVVTDEYLQEDYAVLVEKTGGIYADIENSSFSTSLMQIANLIGKDTSEGRWVILKHGLRYVKLTEEYDQDGDGIPTAEELGSEVTADMGSIIDTVRKNWSATGGYSGTDKIVVYDAKSDPTTADTDSDGIPDKKDTAPWAKGYAGGKIGEVNMIACGGSSVATVVLTGGMNTGHSFLLYESYVNDFLDISKWNFGYHAADDGTYGNSELQHDPPRNYWMKSGDILTFSAGGIGLEDAACAVYNMELYKHENANYSYSYIPNKYISKEMTQVQLSKMIKAIDKEANEKYSAISHQCTHVSLNAWNKTFGTKINPIGLNTPRNLMKYLEGHSGKSDLNLDDFR